MYLTAGKLQSLLLLPFLFHALAGKPHSISFRSPNLYPEGLAWDPSGEHFLVGSLRHRTISTVSDAGVVENLVNDAELPANASILGLAVDARRGRLLAAVHSAPSLPPFDALAAYDLRSGRRLFLARLPTDAERPTANDVAVDSDGNAFVTNSAADFIWKVSANGEPSIFSRSSAFTRSPVDRAPPYSYSGLNGIAYVSKGYLLVVHSNTGKMYKVDAHDGSARSVLLTEDLTLADGIAVRGDGVVLVVSHRTLWFLKSDDSWGQGVVYDKVDLEAERFATSVAVGGEDRAYVLYGHVDEGMKGNAGIEWFGIDEVRSPRESEEEKIWIYVLVGLGLAYFMYWRFQMRQLISNMNKKTN